MKIDFIKSAVEPSHYPQEGVPEVALLGRSNAGKSSFINSLARKKIAKVSQQAGKTRLLNFFAVGDSYRLVDMPGYGYAARSGKEQVSWQKMIERYLMARPTLVGLVLVMDIRRKWTEDEQMLVDLAKTIGRPVAVALNKADKVGEMEKKRVVKRLQQVAPGVAFRPVSAYKGTGIKEFEDYIFFEWVKQ